jgi:23S rRNA pseudouridine2605 synthase
MPSERLQKILAEAGVASRREAERMIVNGRVRVNGRLVRELGSKADAAKDAITVDGKPLKAAEGKIYLAFHKPVNVMVTRKDPEGRPTVFDYLKEIPARVNYVGRLDFDSEGLLLLTNDGELLARLTHPRYEVPKTYHVKVVGRVTKETLAMIARGVDVGDFVAQPSQARLFKENPNNTWIEIVLKEGKNREVRRIFEALGHETLRLVRVAVGPVTLSGLPTGRWRALNRKEVEALWASAAAPGSKPRSPASRNPTAS